MNIAGKRHLILIGLMGAGKTTVGRLLSDRLEMPFVDLDEMIERNQGCAIREIFRRSGEEAFRQIEAEMLRQILSLPPMVLSVGGGAVLRPENRERMAASGWVVHLEADADELIRRLTLDNDKRPLLQGDLAERVRTLSQERAGLYDFADWKVRTDGRAPAETAEEIVRLWQSHEPHGRSD